MDSPVKWFTKHQSFRGRLQAAQDDFHKLLSYPRKLRKKEIELDIDGSNKILNDKKGGIRKIALDVFRPL